MSYLIDQLDLKGTIVTADAMNTQRATVEKIIEKEANYVLPVKKNQETLFNDIEFMFKGWDEELEQVRIQRERSIQRGEKHKDHERLKMLLAQEVSFCGASIWTSDSEKAHGRIESRSCEALLVG